MYLSRLPERAAGIVCRIHCDLAPTRVLLVKDPITKTLVINLFSASNYFTINTPVVCVNSKLSLYRLSSLDPYKTG